MEVKVWNECPYLEMLQSGHWGSNSGVSVVAFSCASQVMRLEFEVRQGKAFTEVHRGHEDECMQECCRSIHPTRDSSHETGSRASRIPHSTSLGVWVAVNRSPIPQSSKDQSATKALSLQPPGRRRRPFAESAAGLAKPKAGERRREKKSLQPFGLTSITCYTMLLCDARPGSTFSGVKELICLSVFHSARRGGVPRHVLPRP